MPLELTPHNVSTVLGVWPERLHTVLPEVFEELLNPNIDAMTLYMYCKSIHDALERDERPEGHMGFDSLGEAAFESGIVPTFLRIAKNPQNRNDQFRALAAHFALQALYMLMRTGTAEERRALLDELCEEGILEFCLENIRDSPIAIHRCSTVNFMRALTSETFLGDVISPADTARTITRMCEHILQGPQLYIDQFSNMQMTWQSFLCFGKFGAPRHKAAKYAPRYYAMSQESAAWTIAGLFIRCPPPDPAFCRDILRHDPTVVDILFKAALSKREPWYGESQVDSIICESLAMLFRVPDLVLPGVDIQGPNEDLERRRKEEWNAFTDSLQILVTRPGWVEMFHRVWNMLEDEKPKQVERMMMSAKSEYYAHTDYKLATYLGIFEFRASCRICMERLLASLSYIAESESDDSTISTDDILSLLRISISAVRPLPKSEAESASRDADTQFYLENVFELFRKPLYAVFTGDDVDSPLHVAPEPYMGPTAHARLLAVLAKRGVLGSVAYSRDVKVPDSAGNRLTTAQLKKACSLQTIRGFLKDASGRVTRRKEEGSKRFRKDGEKDYAFAAYTSAAELAKALILLDDATKGECTRFSELQGVRRELVVCLGNAAEMALGQEKYEQAFVLASSSVQEVERLCLPIEGGADAVSLDIREKNMRRVARAQSGLADE